MTAGTQTKPTTAPTGGVDHPGLFRPRSPETSDRPARLTAQLTVPLAKVAKAGSAPGPAVLLEAAWAVVQARHTGSPEVVFFSSFGSTNPWLASVHVHVDPLATVSDWLDSFQRTLGSIEKMGATANGKLREEDRGLDRLAPTFLIIPENARVFPPRDQIRGPLMVLARLDMLAIEIHYDDVWFGREEIQALGEHLNIVLAGIKAAPVGPVGRLPLLTENERICILDTWNATAVPFAETTRIHQFFEAQAARTPEAIALIFRDDHLTYAELNERANAMARRLVDAGVAPGSFVAICLHRSLDLMTALLALLKAGGAYVPLDPAYPPERLAFMVDDANPALVIASAQTATLFDLPRERMFLIDDLSANASSLSAPDMLRDAEAAYVLYTSGSTGKPKGVVVTHRNVSNFFTAMDEVIGTEPGAWLAVTSVNFDISVLELFWTLARGFKIVLQEEGQWASQSGTQFSLPEQIRRHGVTHLQCTPSLATLLICDADSVRAVKPLRRFLIGGEPLPLDLANRLAEIIDGELINLYGPTETTVWSAAQSVPRHETQILIGRPVANTQLYVLDAQRELAPLGTVGELYIGGDGLALGYLNRPDVTAERFITHSFSPDRTERLYRTGDLVRYQNDGRLEFLGRMDQQIKIRGVRVELGEIEVILREHPQIRDAVVLVQEDAQDKRLVAYLIAAAQPPALPELQQWLSTKLPKILVPSAYLFLPEFPKTPNGKLDRRALPAIEDKFVPEILANGHIVNGHQPAPDTLEGRIAAVWSEALGVENVGLDDRFFDLGGHYFLMAKVHAALQNYTGESVPLLDLFQYPTIRSLAGHLKKRAPRARESAKKTGRNRGKLRLQMGTRQGPRPEPGLVDKSS